jgi:mono/diheme cytochrome c family protein
MGVTVAHGRQIVPLVLLALLSGLALGVPRPAAAGDARSGRQLALQWCSGCHTVETVRASDRAPALAAIAKRPSSTPERLRAWLSTAHDVMPDLSLSRQEIESIIAYLQQLRAD